MSISSKIQQTIIALNPLSFPIYKAHNFYEIPECDEYIGGLVFTSFGKNHKGNVLIFLNSFGQFTVLFMSKEGVPVKEFEDIHKSNLIDTLNYIIHKPIDYGFK